MPGNNPISRRKLIGAAGFASITAQAGLPVRSFASAPVPESITQPVFAHDKAFLARAFEMRDLAISTGDQGYGAVVVKDDAIIGQAPSRVVVHTDPTAHAEMEAIRDAAFRIGSRNLDGCILYSSSRPCPMCEAAAYWAGISGMIHGNPAGDATKPVLCG